eukprot:scaffold73185_cov31-Tisochrysis_lutea.AAC.4
MPVLRAGRNRFAGHSTFLTCMAAWLYGPVTSWTEFTRGCWGALSGYAWSEPGLGGCNPHWRSSVGRGVGKEYGVGGRGAPEDRHQGLYADSRRDATCVGNSCSNSMWTDERTAVTDTAEPASARSTTSSPTMALRQAT